jgi:hypothetical protein
LSFFEDRLFEFVEELGKAGIRGHEKVKRRKRVFEKNAGDFETVPHELDCKSNDSFSDEDFSLRKNPPRLGLACNITKWREVRLFLSNLMDYSIERKGTENLEIWRKMDEWEFEGKLVWKNRSYLRLNQFSWDEVV